MPKDDDDDDDEPILERESTRLTRPILSGVLRGRRRAYIVATLSLNLCQVDGLFSERSMNLKSAVSIM